MQFKELYTYWKVRISKGYEYRKETISEDEIPDLIASRDPNGLHRLVIDIDFPARLVPSRTEGHYHLFLDGMNPINFHQYAELLRSLAKAGIVEHNYAEVSIRRGMTMLRYSKDTLLPTDAEFGFRPFKGKDWSNDPKDLDWLLGNPEVNDGSSSSEPSTQILEPAPRSLGNFVRTIIRRRGIYGT